VQHAARAQSSEALIAPPGPPLPLAAQVMVHVDALATELPPPMVSPHYFHANRVPFSTDVCARFAPSASASLRHFSSSALHGGACADQRAVEHAPHHPPCEGRLCPSRGALLRDRHLLEEGPHAPAAGGARRTGGGGARRDAPAPNGKGARRMDHASSPERCVIDTSLDHMVEPLTRRMRAVVRSDGACSNASTAAPHAAQWLTVDAESFGACFDPAAPEMLARDGAVWPLTAAARTSERGHAAGETACASLGEYLHALWSRGSRG
jgi:hypothetical protein